MAPADRELQITYGGLLIGGPATDYILDGWHTVDRRDGTGCSLTFQVVVTSESDAGFGALCRRIETVFRTPRRGLNVALGGLTLLTASHATASGGFNTQPSIRKIGDTGDTARSRRYECTVEWESPADHSSGLREHSVNVAYDASRIATVSISGAYTATSSASARSKYDGAIGALASSVMSALSISTYELIGEPVSEHDYDNKVLRFDRTYRELIFGQGQNSPNDSTAIVNQILRVTKREASVDHYTPDTDNVEPLARVDLHYEASINSESTTDLDSQYSAIRDWLLQQFSDFGFGAFALVEEAPQFDRAENRLIVDMVAEGQLLEGSYTSRVVSIEDIIEEASEFRGAYSGDPLAHYIYEGFTVAERTVTERSQKSGTASEIGAMGDAVRLAESFSSVPWGLPVGGKWTRTRRSSRIDPITKGLVGNTIDLTNISSVVTRRYTTTPQSNAGGTSSRPPVSGSRDTPAQRNFRLDVRTA